MLQPYRGMALLSERRKPQCGLHFLTRLASTAPRLLHSGGKPPIVGEDRSFFVCPRRQVFGPYHFVRSFRSCYLRDGDMHFILPFMLPS